VYLFSGCDNAGEPIVPDPQDVQMVPHYFSDDLLALEQGIDAVWEDDGIFLAWYDLRDRNIKQYNIYRRRDDELYFRLIKRIFLEQSSDTSFVDDNAEQGLDLNIYYHYYVTATNSQNVESGAADTLKYMLLGKPEARWPDGEAFSADSSLPIISWDFIDLPDLYILRIENVFGQLHYAGVFHSNYDNNSQIKDLNEINDLPAFTPGDYLWRIDSVGPDEDSSGSESVWKTFTIQ
jgi:hypothetical protein